MSMKILLAVDGSEYSEACAALMKRLPFPKDAEVFLLTVIEKGAPFGWEGLAAPEEESDALAAYGESLVEESERLLDTLAADLRAFGCRVRTRIEHGHIAARILSVAEELGVDHIVVGSHGLRGVHRFLLGSVSRAVVTQAPCSVLVVRKLAAGNAESVPRPFDPGAPVRILAAFDGSPTAAAGLALLRALPLTANTEVTVVTVLTVATTLYRQDILQRLTATWREHAEAAGRDLESAVATLREAHPRVTAKLVHNGADASSEILKLAQELDAYVIVLGSTGTSAVERFLLGSVTSRVVDHASCSVWVVR